MKFKQDTPWSQTNDGKPRESKTGLMIAYQEKAKPDKWSQFRRKLNRTNDRNSGESETGQMIANQEKQIYQNKIEKVENDKDFPIERKINLCSMKVTVVTIIIGTLGRALKNFTKSFVLKNGKP